MIVNCEKCGTQYNIDDNKVKPGETKVRCTQCQHVFTIPHPLTLNEKDIFGETEAKAEDAFMKEWTQDVRPQPPQEPSQPVPPATDQAPPPKAFIPPTTEESQVTPEKPTEEMPAAEAASPEQEIFPASPAPLAEPPLKKERKTSTSFLVIMLFLLIVALSLYFWFNRTEGSIPAFEFIYEKIYTLMEGEKAEKLFIVGLRGAEYNLDGGTVYVIQGKVANRSEETKRSVKVQATLFDKVGKEVATSIGYCGVTITDGEIKNSTYDALKSSFGFIGAGRARPVPSQQNPPFTIIFFSPPEGASDFRVDIVESVAAG
jgi:predicted Zn finger-like uncharacterized protein